MSDIALLQHCALAALDAGRAIRDAVHAMPVAARGVRTTTALKPGGQLVMAVDAAAETVGVAHLERLSAALGQPIELVADGASEPVLSVGTRHGATRVVAMLDAVDGTIKVGGLGNAGDGSAVRLANDGGWGVAFACTAPTAVPLQSLTIGDFVVAAVVDGNPPRVPVYPHEVIALPAEGGLATYDVSDQPAVRATLRHARRAYTSTQTTLAQSIVYLDGFQAFDRQTRLAGDETLIVELYRRLINRHDGGAFDVWRQYGNLSALLRMLLGWRGERPWVESQGGAFLVVNENLANLIPSVPIVLGAGGVSVQLDGRPMAERRLGEGRCSVLHAANEVLCAELLRSIPPPFEKGG
ncbi:MAG: hypothetical protein SF182_07695 [Deltaproteobacteria bacterium]|nr:hypothetical protein [Deltaproteobacteria bacterium]